MNAKDRKAVSELMTIAGPQLRGNFSGPTTEAPTMNAQTESTYTERQAILDALRMTTKRQLVTPPDKDFGWVNPDGSGEWYFGEATEPITCHDCGQPIPSGIEYAWDAASGIAVHASHVSVDGD